MYVLQFIAENKTILTYQHFTVVPSPFTAPPAATCLSTGPKRSAGFILPAALQVKFARKYALKLLG